MLSRLFVVLPLTWAAAGAAGPLPEFKHIVTFGDSYTDVAESHDGGVAWPAYAAGYANLTLHPFAVSGATCSSRITPRTRPPVMESQIPAFQAEQSQPDPAETVYTLWIGTNDVGVEGGLITGDAPPGVTIVNVTSCAVDWVAVMYGLGARNFIFMNMIPLELTPLYSPDSRPSGAWNLERNTTEWSLFMTELVSAGNALSSVLLRALAPSLPEAKIALFDTHALFADMYNHPEVYLNGTAPLNVTGSAAECEHEIGGGPVGGSCPPPAEGTDRDSFLWWDELHPSEQADRILAREIVNAFGGNTSWATWIS